MKYSSFCICLPTAEMLWLLLLKQLPILEFKTKHHQKLCHAPACAGTAVHTLGHEHRDL